MCEIWAKSNGVKLHEHLNHILKAFEYIKDKLGDEQKVKAVKFSICLHDLGKVLPSFQIDTLGNRNYEPFDVVNKMPHSLFSLFFIDKEELKNIIKDENYTNFILSAVAYHHWNDSFYEFLERKSEQLRRVIENIERYAKSLEKNLKEEIEQVQNQELRGYLNNLIKWNRRLATCVKRGVPISYVAKPPYSMDFEPLRDKPNKDWILIAGFLQRCDHFASWCETEDNSNNVEEKLKNIEIKNSNVNDVKQKIIQKIKEKKGAEVREENLWQMTKVRDVKDKNLILIAPTGFGKTEFAFLWGAGEKFIYTLPLRSAVNQIFNRAEDIFGEGKVGLLHSDADVYLLEKTGDIGDTVQLYELARNLSYPVIISTGDQFFPYALRPPGYEKIFALFSYARLVIDEVQAYDPKACAIVVEFIKWVHKMGGKFLLMTATLPEFVKKELESENNNFEKINIYEEYRDKLERFVKHKIKVKFIPGKIEAPNLPTDEIVKHAKQGKRVLVILNTVRMAQKVYECVKAEIKEDNEDNIEIYLLHSKYTLADRKKKEDKVTTKFKNPKEDNDNVGKILIATQVVEASLDIDADVLFTELCPLDALVQRMGRVLRRYGACEIMTDQEEPNKTVTDQGIPELEEPNVYVLVFKKGLESGQGNVYHKELLRLSLAWLWKQSEIDQGDLPDFQEKEEFFNEHFVDLIERTENNRKDEVFKIIYSEDSWINGLEDFEFKLSEYRKYELVDRFYKSLPEESSYLKAFYETLEILKAGYMSSRKSEAKRIFRDIHSIQVIPLRQGDGELNKEDIIRDAIKHSLKGYTYFKKEFISKYVINILKKDASKVEPAINLIRNIHEEKLREDLKKLIGRELSDDEVKKRIRKLERYLKGIYISENMIYDEEKGIIRNKNTS